MNTTLAATQANVTVATIRHWCRMRVVIATKTAGRWVIDADSLAARIAIGERRRCRPVELTVEDLVAVGGREWVRGDKHRVYFNNWDELAGLETNHYKSGNISSAAWQGEGISNSQAYKILGSVDKVWFDMTEGTFRCRYGHGESRVADRHEVFEAVVAGIRAAVSAL